ncbi:hypothetical protein PV327_009793 [Microctonus hyperodae]|uniref:pyrroline-5-carboxylate reductase n=1 Tax=Microctonus hyperodae TaxID=165561 RepID=A0AA39F0M3_MICHY|nr:hypothetical protein PV327_009793 [Microctonus hyperodae]
MTNKLKLWRLGFLDCGELAYILVSSLIKRKHVDPKNIWVTETKKTVHSVWKKACPDINVLENAYEVIADVDIVFLGFPASSLNTDLREAILPQISREQPARYKLFVSLIPGVTCAELGKKIADFGIPLPSLQIVRFMPNMTIRSSSGLTLYCRGEFIAESGLDSVIELFSHFGMVHKIDESLMDFAASAPVLYGPAFVYLMMDGMMDGAVKNNLPRDLAIKFVAQIFAGAANMVLSTGKHPGILKDEACSSEGPAIEGIYELESGCVRASIIDAIDAAVRKLKQQNLNGRKA